jgi:tRNA(Arg) A34 adenosine deaminase TadA
MNDTKYMQMAIDIARVGMSKGGSPFGCCIVKGDKVVACEHNVVLQTLDSTAHAEVTALRVACKNLQTIDLAGCTLYSTTEPCPMCFSAIHWANVDKIIFGAGIEDAMSAGFRELTISNEQMKSLGGSKLVIVRGMMAEENRALFKEFVAKGGRTY